MKKILVGLMAATLLAGAGAGPALAGKTDRVVVNQYRDKIAAARGEPGVAQFGSAELDKAEAALPLLEKRLDDRDSKQVESSMSEIDALIASARARADVASAKDRAVATAQIKSDQVASAQAEADRARAAAARSQADAARSQAEAAKARAALADLHMRQTALGATLVLQDVVFQTGKAELKPGAAARLQPLAAYLQTNPEVKVRVDGHTDSQGSDASNQLLSDARASAVKGALATMGVDPSRVESVGHGEAQPVADNSNSAGRQQNRRVEVTLVGQQANSFAALN
ncbi:OmpA family protein [Sphingomonas naphthae]|uniref:OmpA family protein n=1 Tax=Sphingomonas naphthae TaxID=1813468 RepID=A0ABY7TKT1_9SPHN|nr:OmpA family protein [Sphingomonas naphthae]WCT73391.1 OmpA family protein [Sphingomonas naphthae]